MGKDVTNNYNLLRYDNNSILYENRANNILFIQELDNLSKELNNKISKLELKYKVKINITVNSVYLYFEHNIAYNMESKCVSISNNILNEDMVNYLGVINRIVTENNMKDYIYTIPHPKRLYSTFKFKKRRGDFLIIDDIKYVISHSRDNITHLNNKAFISAAGVLYK